MFFQSKHIFSVVQKENAKLFLDCFFFLFLVFNATFNNIMATSFSAGRNQSTRSEPPTMGKQLVNFITRVKCTRFCNLQSRVRTHVVLVMGLYELLGNPTT